MLSVLLNLCLTHKSVLGPWREAWVSMIPKPYEWEGVLMNTCLIVLIETAYKILSKILSDRISSACSTYDVLRGDNFSVLKSTITQSPIFAISSVIENVLEKNQLTSFFVVGAFINDTIWVGSSQTATQHIFNVASEFFRQLSDNINLLYVNTACLSVYTDRSLSGLETPDMMASAAVFFKDIDLGLGVGISSLVSFTITELQAIVLALECIPSSCFVDLFSDSQAALDAYKSESVLAYLDFRNWCWVKHCHIVNVIHHKNLDVNWIKVKNHSGVFGNEHADALARAAAFSNRHLSHIEVGSSFCILTDSLCANVDWSRSSLVWHPNSYLAPGFTSACTASFCSYFIKALYYHLPIAIHKRLYNKHYSSVMCLFCGDVEVSDHVFSCFFDAANHTHLMKNSKVFGLSVVLSAGVIRLLGVADAFGISFRFHKSCLFFSGIRDMISVHINA
ncbi:hypothetical protein G9A89_018599 [Geosiphon pyriformis]|nr:hypothetical protein G9A89_018599 [Geosiphon pyriformis]